LAAFRIVMEDTFELKTQRDVGHWIELVCFSLAAWMHAKVWRVPISASFIMSRLTAISTPPLHSHCNHG
jgi:hypothetical protein